MAYMQNPDNFKHVDGIEA
jgi:hypothetical protein